jgi:hypothetical protein
MSMPDFSIFPLMHKGQLVTFFKYKRVFALNRLFAAAIRTTMHIAGIRGYLLRGILIKFIKKRDLTFPTFQEADRERIASALKNYMQNA